MNAADSMASAEQRPDLKGFHSIFSSSAAITASMFAQYTLRVTPASKRACTRTR